MARPVDANPAQTVERILNAARTLLQENGGKGWSMRRVAQVAKVSTGTLRYYFADRAALLDACLDPFHKDLRALESGLMSLLESAEDPFLVLGQGIVALYRFAVGRDAGHRFLIQALAERGSLDREYRELVREPLLAKIVAIVAPLTKQDARTIRMYALSVTFLLTRYAAATDEELLELTAEGDLEAAQTAVEEHLRLTIAAFTRPAAAST